MSDLLQPENAGGGALSANGLAPTSGLGRRHGTSYEAAFDRWYRYPAGFASDHVKHLLERVNSPSGGLVVDPFAGSAVAGTAALDGGYRFHGIEAHPGIAELGNLKLQPPPDEPDLLMHTAKRIADQSIEIAESGSNPPPAETSLVERSFSPPVLRSLVAIRQALLQDEESPWFMYLKWALLSTLRDVASVKVGWPYQAPRLQRRPRYLDPVSRFLQRVQQMSDDLAGIHCKARRSMAGVVVHGDSRNAEVWPVPGSGHACVTSPPYLNNFDYADATRLEMYFWKEVATWAELCKVVRANMVTATTQQSRTAAAQHAMQELQNTGTFSERIKDITVKLHAERMLRPRGKEYDKVVPDYFLAMSKVMKNLSLSLVPGSPVVWLVGDSAPYGVHVDTPSLLADLASRYGLRLEQDAIVRYRGRRWKTKSAVQHDIQLTERLILLRRS